MAFKPITLASFAQFQSCIAQDHDGQTLSPADQAIVSDCVAAVFTAGDGFEEITLGLFGAFRTCITLPHEGHTLSAADLLIVSECFQGTFTESGVEPDLPGPPPLGPPPGTILYQSDFSGADPFKNWFSRRPGNVTVQTDGGNKFCRLRWNPHSDTRINFLPRYQGVFKCRVEFAMRFPNGFSFPSGGGKHVWMLQSCNQHAGEDLIEDGITRLDFGAWEPYKHWQAINYRCAPGGNYHTDAHKHYYDFELTPGRWHQIRLDCRLNAGKGDDSGHMVLSKDGRIEGELRGEFNIVGSKGGMRVLGFGNVDSLVQNGSDYFDVDNIRIAAL